MNPKLSYSEILALVDSIDPVLYAKTRNHLTGAVTRLSPYISRGVISLPVIRARILAKHSLAVAEKLIQELAWREYFQKVFSAKGEEIFSDLRFARDDWKHHELVCAIVEARTGIAAVDREIQNLINTGYMHNHARLWTAMLACNVAKANWQEMSRWLYYHLIDGDLASNTLSWQWVAGTSSSKQYVTNQALINACSNTNDTGTYLDLRVEDICIGDVPAGLLDQTPFSYQMEYPPGDDISLASGETLFLYHPWSLDPLWHAGEKGTRVLVLEPRLFDAQPISPSVREHLLAVARTHIPDIKVYVGNVETLPLADATRIFSKAHPTTPHYPGTRESTNELFPTVTGYYPSFFKFWQACQESLKGTA